MTQRLFFAVVAALCLIGLVNCTTGFRNTTGATVEVITAMSGTPQSHAIGTAFSERLVATVMQNGAPAVGTTVTFTAPTSGASGTFSDTGTDTTTATTDASGLATTTVFIANKTAGAYQVLASVAGVSTTAGFSLTNTTAAPATVLTTSGASQSVGLNSAFMPLTVTVVDSGQNPVQNAAVVFQAPATGASGTFADTATNTTTATTNSSGIAMSSILTSNTVSGEVMVTATVAGITTPGIFNLMTMSGPPVTIVATTGNPQSAVISTPFAAPLAATVFDSYSNPVSGVTVSFRAPTTGASGTFANGLTAETDTSDSNGIATSTVFTASATKGGPYVVTASVAGLASPANFSLTNTLPFKTYVFYLNGEELNTSWSYTLAGSVQIDTDGNVLTGVQDYNDGAYGITSPQPSGDSITGGTLKGNTTTGLENLTLVTNNPAVGISGTETMVVQFVNPSHALIVQFDGSATSSGSMDVQTLTPSISGSYAYTLSGNDPSLLPVAFGGLFSITGVTTLQNGLEDSNDAGTITRGTALSGTLTSPDSLGRGSITSTLGSALPDYGGVPIVLNYYVVGPEVIRLIDVDPYDTAIGSAFGQGVNASSSSNTSLGNSVLSFGFGVAGSAFSNFFATAGLLLPNSAAGTFTGVADSNELALYGQLYDATLTGSYSIPPNGYGTLTIDAGELGDVSALSIYMTDPLLNLNDPNNTANGLGGGLVLDMDSALSGGTGFMVPQTDSSNASLKGKYAFTGQAYAFLYSAGEFDFIGSGSVTKGVFSGTGMLNDPFFNLGESSALNSGVKFRGTPLADSSFPGRYVFSTSNGNPLAIVIGGTETDFDVTLYQASGAQLIWINNDSTSQFLGLLQQKGTLPQIPAIRIQPKLGSKLRR